MVSGEIARQGHNASPQTGVVPNPDAALDYAHEHAPVHLHHSVAASKHLDPDAAYTSGTTDEPPVIPRQEAMDDVLHRERQHTKGGDLGISAAEKGSLSPDGDEVDPRRHTLSSLYTKWKPVVHIVIWLFFTG